MSITLGMDPGQVRSFAESLDFAAGTLDLLGMQVSGLVSTIPWNGGDADRFRGDWNASHRPTLVRIAGDLRQAARVAADNAAAQDATSATDTGGPRPAHCVPVSTVGNTNDDDNWLAEGLEWVAGGADWVGDSAEEGFDWLGQRVDVGYENITDSLRDLFDVSGHQLGLLGQWAIGDEPSVMELVASGLLARGRLHDTLLTVATLGQVEVNLFDDGEPWAGEPIPVGVSEDGAGRNSDGHVDSFLPTDLGAIAENTGLAYSDAASAASSDGAVRVTRIAGPDGPAYIVDIPGTQDWSPFAAETATDFTGNLVTASGQLSTSSEAVLLAMRQAGINPNDPVLLSGHSQGGMTAAALAADPAISSSFNVTNVMAFGSPVDTAAIPSDVDAISFEHLTDLVPRLDLGGVDVGGTTPASTEARVVLANPPGAHPLDLPQNHDFGNYAASIARAEEVAGSAAEQYASSASMQVFLTGDPARVQSYVVPIERRH